MRLRQRLGLGATVATLALAITANGAFAQQGPPPGCPPPPGMAGGPPPGMPPGGPPPGGPPPGMPPGGGPPSENDMRATQTGIQAALDLLGISSDQMFSQAQAGHSLGDIAGARGIELSTLVQTMTGNAANWLGGEVASGRLSQSDADAILQRTQQFTLQMVTMAPPAGGPPPGGPPPGCPPPPGMPGR